MTLNKTDYQRLSKVGAGSGVDVPARHDSFLLVDVTFDLGNVGVQRQPNLVRRRPQH